MALRSTCTQDIWWEGSWHDRRSNKVAGHSSLLWCFYCDNCMLLFVVINDWFFYQGSHTSWKVLGSPRFFLENSRTWVVLENHFGFGKSWKLKLNVLESYGKISLKKSCILLLAQMKIFFFCSLRSWITCSPLVLNLSCQFVIFKHLLATKRSWKNFHGGSGKSWRSLGFFVCKRVGNLC